MKRFVMVAALALGALAFADDPAENAHHFADAPLSKLTLVYTVSSRGVLSAMVEGPEGQDDVVREGELLAKEGLRVIRVGRGCLSLVNGDGLPSQLCVDEAGSPRS
jgi:Tfp pilus assembly protein PilP